MYVRQIAFRNYIDIEYTSVSEPDPPVFSGKGSGGNRKKKASFYPFSKDSKLNSKKLKKTQGFR